MINDQGHPDGTPQKIIYIKKAGAYKFVKYNPKTAAHLNDFSTDLTERE